MENENSSKRKKMPPSRSVTVEGINAFPDDVLTHILSFLPTKEAFRTSVLSKRWFPLCYSLSVLYFNDEGVNNSEDLIQFRQFMDAVMFSPHSQHLTLKFLYLRCFSELWDAKADCFDKWVEAAKRRCVKVLDLRFPGSLAPTIFCCKTLVVLNLREIRIATVFHCSVDLPLLKTLYLIAVSFEDQEDFMKLLSGCPKLEDLKAGLRVKENAGVTPRESYKPLSNLIVASIWLCQVPLTMVYNVQYLSVYMFGKSLSNEQINSYYKGFPVFGNLTKLHLNCSEDIHDWGEVVKMLQNCPKLQNLEIEKCYYSTTIEDWEYPDLVPECVSSHLITCRIKDYEAVEVDFRFAAYILQNARLLQVMTIFHTQYSEAMENPQFLENLSSCSRISPACKLSLFESN